MRRSLGPMLAIAGVALRRLSRDRVALFFTFALPLLIIVLLGAAIPSAGLGVGLLDSGDAMRTAQVRAALTADADLRVVDVDDESAARRAIRRATVDAVVIVPAEGAALELLLDDGSTGSVAARTRITGILQSMQAEEEAADVAAQATGRSAQDPAVRSALVIARALPPAVYVAVDEDRGKGYRSVSSGEYATVGELVLFIFLIALTGAGDIVDSRRLGIARRSVAAPVRAITVVIGEGIGRFAVAVSQAVLIVAVTAVLFGISWGNPLGVAAVIGAFALLATAVALFVGAYARSSEQAVSLGPVIGIGLGMLGGCMWPLDIVPPALRLVGHVTPHAWAVDGLVALMGATATTGDVLRAVGVLLGGAAVLLPSAAYALRRRLSV
jgi:ABC-2 type transport system permease protein